MTGGGPSAAKPLVVMVVGGRGGSGRSNLALDVAWGISAEAGGRHTLLVDADELNPGLDLRLGAAAADLDRLPAARLDQVLLRLPELAAGRLRLESLLWAHPRRSLRALLAAWPGREPPSIGPEHLDYLLRYLLQPTFDVVVVDGGPRPGAPGSQARFWSSRAHLFLLPLRPWEADVRATERTLQSLESEFAVGRDRCRGVVTLGPGESLRGLRRQPLLHGLELWPRPWAERSATLAEARHVPVAEIDRKVAAATAGLTRDLWSAAIGASAVE